MSNPEYGPAPSCDYVHGKAIELNETYDQLDDFAAWRTHDETRLHESEQALREIALQASDNILEREFLRDGQSDMLDSLESTLLGVGYRIEELGRNFYKRRLEKGSPTDTLEQFHKARARMVLYDIEEHSERWHARNNEACYITNDYEPPINRITARARIVGGALLRRFGMHKPKD